MTVVLILFMMMLVGADVGAAAVFDPPKKEEVIITLYSGAYRLMCCGIWNVAGMKTIQGLSFQDGIIDAGRTLRNIGPGSSEFLEYFMCALKESKGCGDGFRDVESYAPLSQGTDAIDDGLMWAARFSTNNNLRDNEQYSEVVSLCILGKSVTVSGYVGCPENAKKRKR